MRQNIVLVVAENFNVLVVLELRQNLSLGGKVFVLSSSSHYFGNLAFSDRSGVDGLAVNVGQLLHFRCNFHVAFVLGSNLDQLSFHLSICLVFGFGELSFSIDLLLLELRNSKNMCLLGLSLLSDLSN